MASAKSSAAGASDSVDWLSDAQSTWRVVRAEELAKDYSPESRKRDAMVLARGGSAREEAETVSGAGERRLDATRARGYWLAEWRRRRGWAYSLACTGPRDPPLPMLQNSNRPDRPTDCVVLSPAN